MTRHPSAGQVQAAIRSQAPRPPAIEVLEVRPVEGMGNLRAFATVKLGAIVIRGCRIVQQPGQKPWVSMPAQQDRNGKWHPVVSITRPELLEQVKAMVLEAWGQRR